jgi:hypothetical protein
MMHVLRWLPLSLAGGALLIVLLGLMGYGLDRLLVSLHWHLAEWASITPLTLPQAFCPWHVLSQGLAPVRVIAELYVQKREPPAWGIWPIGAMTLAAFVGVGCMCLRIGLQWLTTVLTTLRCPMAGLFEAARLVCCAVTCWVGFPVVMLPFEQGITTLHASTSVLGTITLVGVMVYVDRLVFQPVPQSDMEEDTRALHP